MHNYHYILNYTVKHGKLRDTRAGPTLAAFGHLLTWDINWYFPAITTKELNFSAVAAELAGFLRGETDAAKMGTKIWLKDAERWHSTPGSASTSPTDLGRIYGWYWRNWGGDQLRQVVDRIKTDPNDRRLLISCWNPAEQHLGCLPPCHYAFQFYVENGVLSCIAHMRSVDLFLGLPFDIASYALLTYIVAQECKLKVGQLKMTLGDSHIYANHIEQVKLLLKRSPRQGPQLSLDAAASIDNFTADMASLTNYKPYPPIKAPLNVGEAK